MPARSDKVKRLYEEADDYELPYLSKSRIKQWLENPEHFRFKYLEGIDVKETKAMRRGSAIHETFERYYENVVEAGGFGKTGQGELLHDNRDLWADFVDPYVSNFILWEARRWNEADCDPDKYLPISIEEEHWRDPIIGLDGEPEWMGLADVILPAASLSDFGDEGVVIVDFKTGDVPDEQYRSPGIYTELEYYVMLFENKYDVVGAGAYYPRHDTFLAQPDDPEHREDVLSAVEELVAAARNYTGDTKFEINPGPLCKWGEDDDEESAFYGLCSQCTWGVPANNRNALETLVDEGYSDTEMADHLGCEPGEVSYWKYKFNL